MKSPLVWKTLKISPALLGLSLFVTSNAYAAVPNQTATNESTVKLNNPLSEMSVEIDSLQIASDVSPGLSPTNTTADPNRELLEQIQRYSGENNTESLDQVTSVGQLRDVSPGDWAYEALRSLVERYGCIAGYPDGTYRGNRALTRYEFAAGLNSCLQQIERLMVGDTPDGTELETLRRLIQEFEAELATLGARVDNLEGRVAFLEDNQFSTTTKLRGEVIFNLGSAFGDEKADNSGEDIEDNITLSHRTRLNFDTSFTGEDRLRVRLQAGNTPEFDEATGTEMARLGFEAASNNDVEVNDLYYRFPLGDNIRLLVGANGFDFNDIAEIHNPILESSGTGALNRFNRRNPFVFRNNAEQGVGANIQFSDFLSLDLGYLTGESNSPADKDGLFDGDFTAISQLNLALGEKLDLGFAFGYSYYPGEDVNLSGSTGSPRAKEPFGEIATSALRFGIQGSWRLTPTINLAGWGGYIDAEAEAGAREGDNADLWTWVANVSFLDLGKEGAALSIMGGMPPKLTNVDSGDEDEDTSFLIEAQYQYPITDNILITPGAYVILNPNHDDGNDNIWVGTIRTTFSF
ncbi:MAG: iron uptake porin [Coleofasciculus sp. G1-WW12-02]|uniref:iron uptake porin n=1 Tax=Coleofasciculus sp. G1-WW12-02 TaxID=3068483 RepID=UPI0032FC3638